jgi:GTP cyclohydrolase II
VAETKLPTDLGQFQLRAYRVPGAPLGQEPCVIYSRDRPPFGQSAVPVRIHDQCLTSEVFRSQRYARSLLASLPCARARESVSRGLVGAGRRYPRTQRRRFA